MFWNLPTNFKLIKCLKMVCCHRRHYMWSKNLVRFALSLIVSECKFMFFKIWFYYFGSHFELERKFNSTRRSASKKNLWRFFLKKAETTSPYGWKLTIYKKILIILYSQTASGDIIIQYTNQQWLAVIQPGRDDGVYDYFGCWDRKKRSDETYISLIKISWIDYLCLIIIAGSVKATA